MGEAFIWPDIGRRAKLAAHTPDELRELARSEGYEEGLTQGLDAGGHRIEQEIVGVREKLAAALEMLEASKRDAERVRLDGLAKIAHALCCRLLRQEFRTTIEVFERVLADGLTHLSAELTQAEILVNPDDYDFLHERYQGAIVLHADPGVPPAGLSVRTPERSVDFDPIALLNELFQDIRDDIESS